VRTPKEKQEEILAACAGIFRNAGYALPPVTLFPGSLPPKGGADFPKLNFYRAIIHLFPKYQPISLLAAIYKIPLESFRLDLVEMSPG